MVLKSLGISSNNHSLKQVFRFKNMLVALSLFTALSGSLKAQNKPLYTQSSQGWICVTKNEFKRRCGLHSISQSQIDSVHVGQNLGVNLGYRISTDKAGNTFYWIDTKGTINTGIVNNITSNNSSNTEHNVSPNESLQWIDPNQHTEESRNQQAVNQGETWDFISPEFSADIDPKLKSDIEKFFGEFSVTAADYYYTGVPFEIKIRNPLLAVLSKTGFLPIEKGENMNCSQFCLLRMKNKIVGVSDSDEHMGDIVDIILESNGNIDMIYKMLCEYKKEYSQSYGSLDEEMRILFKDIEDYISTNPPYIREIKTKEEFFKKNPQDCFEDMVLQMLEDQPDLSEEGANAEAVNVQYSK